MTTSLRSMSPAEFDEFAARSLDDFAADLAQAAGRSLEQARARAVEQFAQLLPNGSQTAGHWFRVILDDDRPVGQLWVGPHPQRPDGAYVYDIVIDEAERGRGFGRAAMLAVDELARQAGLTAIGLNVFGVNDGARRLYASLGYETVSTQMLKRL